MRIIGALVHSVHESVVLVLPIEIVLETFLVENIEGFSTFSAFFDIFGVNDPIRFKSATSVFGITAEAAVVLFGEVKVT